MKLKLLFFHLFLIKILSAQTFTEVSLPPDFDNIGNSSIAFSDVDGDNDSDILITGRNNSDEIISKLYKNDGQGNFTEVTGTPFEGVRNSSIAFADVDGDTDSDVLITGWNSSFQPTSKLYKNDGQGNFTEMLGTPFEGVRESSIAFADVDGDNDPDVLITGGGTSSIRISKLYINDGQGNFSEMLGTPFAGVRNSSIAFSDVDNDNDPDVLITGNIASRPIAKLYINNGQGNFTEMIGTPFEGVNGSIAFSDVDGDNDSDVLITGIDSSFQQISKLYTNDGQGNFTEMTGTPFEGVWESSIGFSDVDGDNDSDVLITGLKDQLGTERISKLYTNDGQGNFTEVTGTPFEDLGSGSIGISDVDGDNAPDILLTGFIISGERVSKLYINDLMVSSSDINPLEFNSKIVAYPNPVASNDLKIDFYSTENGFVLVKIYDLVGQLLSQQKEISMVGLQTMIIDISDLSAGNYFLQIENKKETGVASFIVP